MGARNPDRIPLRYWRHNHETVAQIRKAGWAVISQCNACSLQLSVDLDEIARVSGSDTSLWNRKKRCRKLYCKGYAILWAKPPFHGSFSPLEAPWPEGEALEPPA